MIKYGVNELRRKYLEFFESKGHLKMNSFSLVPQNDNSLLLINAGMAPLKPYFTGQEIPPRRRVTTCQKCIRTGDIDNVGKTARHLTFFEMLGNFSFGDYFKHEAINWSWEFLTKVIGMEEDRLYPSIYADDDEAFNIWTKEVGVPAERITRFYRDENGDCDNFWEHGAGPCGPCSEIYYDRGIKYGCGKPDCKVGCDCDRFMEVWNNVFTQFESDGHHHYTELKQKNIDTGMGLERLAVVVQDVDSVFDIDTMKAIRDKICELAGVTYMADEHKDVSIRLITDHIRSVTFMASDGIIPSNEGRGYVLRRLLRRAARHGRTLGIDGLFLAKLATTVIDSSKDGYPELDEKRELILKVLTTEEENFNKTIDQGLVILSDLESRLVKEGKTCLDGEDAFRLYDTYGFPIDLTNEILEEKGFTVDMDGFNNAMNKQKETARGARKETNYMGADATVYDKIDTRITSEFVGYDTLETESEITVLTTSEDITDTLAEGMEGTIIVNKTPFYATMGGQQGDTGVITCNGSVFEVIDTIRLKGGRVGHVGKVTAGSFNVGDKVTLTVDEKKRIDTAKNHSATHLLQEALRIVLGNHVEQAGSLVTPDRLRFDFTHFQPMTEEEIEKVEAIVNEQIAKSIDVETKVLAIEDAKKTGAKALFNEKYGDTVRVVCMGDFSKEFCGGTHVSNTGLINSFKIVSESGVAAGVRRIEALTGNGVFAYYKDIEKKYNDICKAAKATPANVEEKIAHMQAEIKSLNSEIESLKNKAANEALGDVLNQAEDVNGVKFLAVKLNDVDMNELRNLSDDLKSKIGSGVVVLASAMGSDKVNLIVTATDDIVKAGVHAGNIIKSAAPCVGGGGGGRPNMAQAGGKNPAGIEKAFETAKETLASML
ncbi:alanine--tRNA ligase [Eshraghiella crossota]|jgi:alanyl-tRNA synthetase|uniref:alanine--tRNA ligase n=1 Tax=Eshraghiella crossota TaxID=45851 RepID=UPI0009672481|nr:MAG: alanine--tRNA ligase [Butyrivibrio crossotus]